MSQLVVPSPQYLALLRSGELARRCRKAIGELQNGTLCPNRCGVNRTQSKSGGRCHTGRQARVCSYGPHFGEERPLVGRQGSGTIFFSWCNLRCVFCQNWEISQAGEGSEVSCQRLAEMMLELQDAGCHNINMVTPSHVIPNILEAVLLAAENGLRLPLVYNTGGYDSFEALQLLDGIVDIYMPDMKFADSSVAAEYLGVADYAEINRAAVKEMHRQVGDLQMNSWGLAWRGLLIRHLVLPENLAGSERILGFIARELSRETYINIMDQYRPCHRANDHPPLDRRPTDAELLWVREQASEWGLHRFDR